MPNLWELTNEYQAALGAIGDSETPELDFVLLNAIQDDWEHKIENVGKWMIDLAGDIKKLKDGEARLKARREVLERQAARIKGWLHDDMTRTGRDKVHTAEVTVSLRKCPVSCVVDDMTILPEDFWAVEESIKVDKKALIAQFKTGGKPIPGASFVKDKRKVQIK